VLSDKTKIGCPADPMINSVIPTPRAGHAMASIGPSALMCGGHKASADGTIALSGNRSKIECFWFTPLPEPRWDPVQLKEGTISPSPRTHASMVFDGDESLRNGTSFFSAILFGGQDASGERYGDCWFMEVTSQLERTVLSETFEWQSCSVSPGMPSPSARFGHGSVAFRHTLYVLGGFASDGSGVAPQDDMWKLVDYQSEEDRYWEQVMPTSSRPTSRGFHAVWLAGFKLIVHGGQGAGGAGVASVLGDTWAFDLFTLVWIRFGSSDAVPVASHLSAAPWTDSKAVAFGGLSANSISSSKLFIFNTATGWTRGACIHTRVGHVFC
jgi:hypothetical protein